MNNNNILDPFSTFLQTYNTALLEDDASNNDIVNHLHKQDTEYLERILKRLDEIEKRIERLKNWKMIKHENEKFSSCICKHVFDRIKIEIIDNKNDEEYQLDMPLEIYEELKKLIIEFEKKLDK